jgi:octaprenyl-diphosphate synthase
MKNMKQKSSLKDLYHPVAEQLAEVQEDMQGLWTEMLSLVNLHMYKDLTVGGKMLRPALCLLAAGTIGEKQLNHYIRLATAVETLHIASLIHDDIIDEAILRRGQPALNGLWSKHATILGGDYLVARAIESLTEYDSCPLVKAMVSTVRHMAEGELVFYGQDNATITTRDCLNLAEQKTAALFAQACCGPARIASPVHVQPLHQFGIALGVAFQVMDDLIDLTQATSKLGKPSCGDIAEDKTTIPILFLQESLCPEETDRLQHMRSNPITDDDRKWVAQMMAESGATARTQAIADQYSREAIRLLETLPENPCRGAMTGLVHLLLHRTT